MAGRTLSRLLIVVIAAALLFLAATVVMSVWGMNVNL